MSILVTGGAGYIGSHMALRLVDAGETVVVYDNLSTGNRNLVPDAATFIQADLSDHDRLVAAIRDHSVSAILHFAGSIIVPESVADPLKYYRNNTALSRDLIDIAVAQGVAHFIFSSTAAVYSAVGTQPVTEEA
ncbi:MAG: NAD-dependent epimerase/dehydratase family protein, partial [Paracoccaceae bacterium]